MSLAAFVTDTALSVGTSITLGEEAAHHMRVRRLESGVRIALLDGSGARGTGTITQLAKRHATVNVEACEHSAPPAPIHLILPVADKERMLWLAEKATELQVASWRPVAFRRSRNVVPRGEGTTFQQKTRARMVSALEQSGGAWLPTMHPEATVDTAIAARPEGIAIVLERVTTTILEVVMPAVQSSWQAGRSLPPVTIVVGPEGGIEAGELELFKGSGFVPASLGETILRFETAALAGVAAVRAALELGRTPSPAESGWAPPDEREMNDVIATNEDR